MAPLLRLTHKSAQLTILTLFLCVATSSESRSEQQQQQQQLRVFSFPAFPPWCYGLVGADCDGLGGLWNEFWGVSGLGGGLVGCFGPWGAGFGGGGFIGGGVGALSLGGQRYYAQRLVSVDRPGTRLQHIANVFCSHTYYPIDSTYR